LKESLERVLKKDRFGSILKGIIGFVLIVLILQTINVPRLIKTLTEVDVKFLILAILAYIIQNLILSFRLFKCINFIGYRISWAEIFWLHLFGMLWSDVTPGQAGYLILVYPLSKSKKIPVSESLSCLGTITSLELIVKAATGAISLAFLITQISDPAFIFLGLMGIIAILIMSFIFLMLCWADIKILSRIVKRFPLFGMKLLDLTEKFKSASQALKRKAYFIIYISLIGWLLRGFEWTFLGYACEIPLSFIIFLMLHPLLTAVRFVPLTPAGLGMFEGITILGFSLFGVPAENAFLFSLFDRVDNIVVDIFAVKEFKRM